jgi:hypothetical protein
LSKDLLPQQPSSFPPVSFSVILSEVEGPLAAATFRISPRRTFRGAAETLFIE